MASPANQSTRTRRSSGPTRRGQQRSRYQRRRLEPPALQRARVATYRRHTTMLDLIQVVQQHVATDAEVVAIVTVLVNTGAVVLAGNFAGMRI